MTGGPLQTGDICSTEKHSNSFKNMMLAQRNTAVEYFFFVCFLILIFFLNILNNGKTV